GLDAADFFFRQEERAVADALPVGLDLLADDFGAGLVDENLDARLVLVVPAALEIVDAENGLHVAEEVLFRQEVADLVGDHRRPAEAAADIHGKTDFAVRPAPGVDADVMDLHRGAVALGAGHG